MKSWIMASVSLVLSPIALAQAPNPADLLKVVENKPHAYKRMCAGKSESLQASVRVVVSIPQSLQARDEAKAEYEKMNLKREGWIKETPSIIQSHTDNIVRLNEAIARSEKYNAEHPNDEQMIKINNGSIKLYKEMIESEKVRIWLAKENDKAFKENLKTPFYQKRDSRDGRTDYNVELSFDVVSMNSSLSGPVLEHQSASYSLDFKPGKWLDNRTSPEVWDLTVYSPYGFTYLGLTDDGDYNPMLIIQDGKGSTFHYDGAVIPLTCRDIE